MIPETILLGVLVIAAPQTAPPSSANAFTVSGAERIFERQEQQFTLMRQGENLLLRTNRNVHGALAGEERSELAVREGIFTWLAAQPAWTLQLLAPSSEQMRYLDPPRFQISDLRNNRPAVERALGGKVTVGKREKFGKRDCITLLVTHSQTGRQQGFWVDLETGLILRHVDMVNGLKDYERWFTQFTPQTSLPAENFQIPTGSQVIRGVPDAGILRHAAKPRDANAYREDVSQIRQKTVLGAGNWLYTLPDIPGFAYTHTVHQERVGTFSKEQLARRASLYRNQGVFSAIPYLSDIPVVGRFYTGGATQPAPWVFTGQEGGNAIALALGDNVLTTAPNAPVQGIRVFTSDRLLTEGTGSAISLKFLSPTLDPATRKRLLEEEKQMGADSRVQSDFLDPKTGDTLSFLQLRHRGIASLFPGLALPEPSVLTSKERGRVLVYALTQPFALNLISWQTGEGSYVLASTRLTPKELLALAEKAEQ